MPRADNKLVRDALDILQARLPASWKVSIKESKDLSLQVRGPDGRRASCALIVKRVLQPRGVLELRVGLQDRVDENPVIVVSPYLSPAVRDRLVEAGIGYVDLTGNVFVLLNSPGLFVDARGADVNPDPEERASRTLQGGKAGRVVRALIDSKRTPGVRKLAEQTGVSAGYVSRLLALLDEQALIERTGRGRVESVDWQRLLDRWTQDAPLSSRGAQTMCLAPRGIPALTEKLSGSNLNYAVTGTLAVGHLAPVAQAHLGVVYVEDLEEAINALDLRVTERGANVMLIEPADEGVFVGSSTLEDGLRVVAPSQAAADLATSPGRGPEEAEALIDWMKHNEEAWRG